MKVFVSYKDTLYTVPCGDGKLQISSLVAEAIKRIPCSSINPTTWPSPCKLFMAGNRSLLHPDDLVCDVLEDGSYAILGEQDEEYGLLSGKLQQHVIPRGVKLHELDGESLSSSLLVEIGKGGITLDLSKESWDKVKKSRALLDQIVADNRVAYGITTGFGKFARVVIEKEKLSELQLNLIRSHAVGVGEPLSVQRTRMLFALRMNVLAKGYSGIGEDTLSRMLDIFNASCMPLVPEKGTVGASGDLAPLAHLALGLIGEGKMWSPKTGWGDAARVLEANNVKQLTLKPKEGLALINGTQLIASLGAEALERSEVIAKQADVVAALSLEVLKGTSRAFTPEIHAVRPHKGQGIVAERLRSVLGSDLYPSEIAESHRYCNKVQDAYTLRCCPQVHGIVNDTIEFVRGILTTELNSATDNPMVFAEIGEIISGGNFHGEYPAKALDYLAIGIHEVANMSERRLERLVNPAYSDLPAFLISDGGLNSGFMMAQVTAAALVSENKVLCHPSSVDSLTTSAGTEDHVSMGGFAARKALTVVEHVEQVLAIELMAACQGLDLLKPLKTSEPLQAVYDLIRTHVSFMEKDRYMAPDIDKVTNLLRENRVWKTVEPYVDKYRERIACGMAISRCKHSPTSTSLDEEPPQKAFKI